MCGEAGARRSTADVADTTNNEGPAASRLPVFSSLLVAAAVAVMIGLGLWQLQRLHWKEALLAQYRAALGAPDLPELPRGFYTRHDIRTSAAAQKAFDSLSFRKVRVRCTLLGEARSATPILAGVGTSLEIAGHNRAGLTGYRHIQSCSTEPFQGRILVDLGWSRGPKPLVVPQELVAVTGRLIPSHELTDRMEPDPDTDPIPLLLVSDVPWPGLEPSAAPGIEAIPNNHLFYAIQWFFFAGAALVIYILALRKRRG